MSVFTILLSGSLGFGINSKALCEYTGFMILSNYYSQDQSGWVFGL